MKSLAQMKNRLKELEAAIKETEARLPAHSVKPPVMIDLLALEDEYETPLAIYSASGAFLCIFSAFNHD
ncbi:MAG: hypothetical protein KFF68_14720 [Desulfosarcina sp.]|nr:hypothetical protein [Desulfosarcina sp.]